uniref:Integrator complex subunit 4 n=1 Tax=Ornithorhynchus anatinus TaxID=9258 RepID=A0A6I8PF81_ORNAN
MVEPGFPPTAAEEGHTSGSEGRRTAAGEGRASGSEGGEGGAYGGRRGSRFRKRRGEGGAYGGRRGSRFRKRRGEGRGVRRPARVALPEAKARARTRIEGEARGAAMAAHLKKRVYEEFTKVVQQQHDDASGKKLRLTKPSKSAALHVDLCKASSPADALQHLLQFARSPVEADSVEGVARVLLEHYYKESDASVRLKIASLLGLLSKTAGFSPDCIVDDAVNALQNEKSHQVLAQLLDTLLAIGTRTPENPAVRTRLVDVARKHLTDTSHGVRNKCLRLLGHLGAGEKAAPKEAEGRPAGDVQKTVGDYFTDQDPRVRTAAVEAMLQLHERGLKLHQAVYNQACRLLSDDYEQVRSAAVRLVWVLSQLYPESIVPIPSSNEEIRLVDDAFGKVCHMVSDGSWVVRVRAAKLLGSMQQVSSHFLEQTLDKKLMSDLRRKRTAHERAKELYSSGEFSSGRKWGDDAPKEEVDTGAVNLIESGACGAFVHGLEDEMYEVRIAAVEALCMLAQSSPAFAEKCLDFLVDMFNDEIEEVRLRSIHTMRKISNDITLREDQLDTVLAVLEDSSRDIREALHELLCCTNVSTKEGIHLALVELLKNLTKYPTDRQSIWKCLKFLGGRHPTLVLPLVPELLSTHPFFDTAEPDMDDPAYIAVLVLIFNAAQTCPTMPALFSDHTFRHHAYLRDSLSHLVPALRVRRAPAASRPRPPPLALVPRARAGGEDAAATPLLPLGSVTRQETGGVPAGPRRGPRRRDPPGGPLPAVPAAEPGAGPRLATPRPPGHPGAARVHHPGPAEAGRASVGAGGGGRLLRRLPPVPAASHQGLAGEAVDRRGPPPPEAERAGVCRRPAGESPPGSGPRGRRGGAGEGRWGVADVAPSVPAEILEETYKMEFMYSGVESRQVVIVHHMRLQAKALQLIVTARTTRGIELLFGMCEKFLREVDVFQRCFGSELPQMQDSFVDKLLDLMPRLVTSKPLELVKILQTALRQSSFLPLPLPERIHRASASIVEPAGESDNPLRFTSGLVVALAVDATLEHVRDPQRAVKVQVLYPDGRAQIVHPKPADFRNPGPGRHRLITQIYLSHTAWTEPCQVEVRLLLAYSCGRGPAGRPPKAAWGAEAPEAPPPDAGPEGTIPFGRPVKVYIVPKPARR